MSQSPSFFFTRPAEYWYDALPLGNGRMGAMVSGGVRVERLYLSETTFWSGRPSPENNPPGSPEKFREIRRLLLANDIPAANRLARELEGRKLDYGSNLPFGSLRLVFDHEEIGAWGYRRSLDLDDGIALVEYRVGRVEYRREVFASAAHQVLVIRLSCSAPGQLGLRAQLDGDDQPFSVCSSGSHTILLETQARERLHSDGKCGVDGHARLMVLADSGKVSATPTQVDVEAAGSVTLLLAMGTTFGGQDPQAACRARVDAAASLGYAALREAHVTEHRAWMERCRLDLGPNPHPDWPIDRRIDAVRQGASDPHLYALLFQLGRYLILNASRPDSPLPADLQGAWNDNKAARIGWTCDCHLDINTQMNYWIAEVGGLGECTLPLARWVRDTLVPSGRQTARDLYGLPGWVAHIFSNPWGFSAWGWSIDWGVFPTGGVWTAMHLWDRYAFSGDREFLASTAYPVLAEAAEFCLAYLFEDPRTGLLATGPSNSPENQFRFEGQNFAVALSPTVDHVLIRALFEAVLQAGEILSTGPGLRERIAQALPRLAPYKVGKHGQVQEWLEDYEEAVPGHRHTSHLLGLYPFAQITPEVTPALARAARVSLERRINAPDYEEGAWARNNITLFYARLQDPAAAYASLSTLFRVEAGDSLLIGPRIAPATAYEMDYNTGASAAIAEMLLHSHAGCIALLPALPMEWPNGKFNGLRARGGFEIDLEWEAGKPTRARVRSHRGGPCRLRASGEIKVTCGGKAVQAAYENRIAVFETMTGREYEVEY